MKAQCLPFTEVPHTTRLFSDFLYDGPKVSGFYPRPPRYSEWLAEQSQAVQYDPGRRRQVTDVLLRQNRSWGASAKTLSNIASLAKGGFAAVTGQQVGFLGGPLFTLFKVLSAVKLAQHASGQGIPTVPIFWLATSDHDLAEIDHTFLSGPNGEPQRISVATLGTAGAPVGGIRFAGEVAPAVEQAVALLGESEASEWLRESYRPGETLGSAFAKFYARAFGQLGVILLDPNDAGFHELAQPVYAAAIEQSSELSDSLLERGKQLVRAGYHEQVKVTPSSTAVFALRKGARTPIHRMRMNGGGNGNGHGGVFEIKGEKISREDLLQRIAGNPSEFSPNALLRPVVQDSLLPTLAYVGGPAEVAYFAQSAILYEKLLGRVTPIVPRFSATMIDAKQAGLLERYGLSFTDVYAGPEALLRRIAARTLPPEIQAEFDRAQQAVEKSLSSVKASLHRLDPTLTDASDRAERKIRYQLQRLRQRTANAELRRGEILQRHAALLSNSLFPNKVPQERELAAAQFLSRFGADLLPDVLENVHPDCVDHQLLFV